jgi:hypothetical protein
MSSREAAPDDDRDRIGHEEALERNDVGRLRGTLRKIMKAFSAQRPDTPPETTKLIKRNLQTFCGKKPRNMKGKES